MSGAERIATLNAPEPALTDLALESLEPVTESQRELWFAGAIGPAVNIAFNEGLVWTLRGALDVAALERAVQHVVARHESLRASFTADGRFMRVHHNRPVRLVPRELPWQQVAAELTGTSLDLELGPLFRFELVRSGENLHHLLFVAHHIVCDGWSYRVISEELCALYNLARAGKPLELPHAADRYTDYAQRENEFHASPSAESCLEYWMQQLADAPAPLALPPDRPHPATRTYEAARYDHLLDADATAALRKFAASQNVSLVTALFGTFAILAHRLTEADDVVLGVAAAGQTMHDLPHLVGHCVHFLPVRLRPRPDLTVRELLRQARGTMLDAVDNQGVTFGTLLKHLKLKRDPARPPLISIAMNLDGAEEALRFAGLEVTSERIHRQAENFELFLNVVDDGRELVLQCSYNTRLFRPATMRARMQEYEVLLRAVPAMADAALEMLPLTDATAPEGTAAPIPEGSIHELVAQQAGRCGDEIAVECENQTWTYRRLMARADAIAATLQARGLKPGDFAGVCLRRTPELAASLLAVLKCGAAYVPLDPDLPAARLQFMFTDAKARLVICEKATADALDTGPKVFLEEMRTAAPAPVNVVVDPEAPAYAIYTSGSTGQPKGVVAHHRGVINCLSGTRARIGMEPVDALLAIATYAFDASVLEFFLPLMTGGKLVIATEEETQDGSLLARAIERHDITRIFTAPAAWRLLLAAGWQGKDDLVGISWAEPLTPDLAQALLPKVQALWNLYGPTETHVWMLGCQVRDADAPITIGTPIPNTRVYILDAQKRKVPSGATGELYIGGAGLAIGYLNRAELNAEKFVDDPFNGGRMYRTGDLARWTPEGEVQCLGRADHQVKLRGFRIELGEVEAALRQCAGVDDCACGVRDRAPGDARLVAWIKPRAEDGITASDVRQELREKLPSYMVPQHFRMLDQMPRLPNGKLDRKSLPDPFGQAPDLMTVTTPRSATEDRIAAIWRDVLGHENFTVNDRLLDVGGHSLLAVEVAIKVRESFGTKLLLREVMTDTLAQIARACTEGTSTTVH